jgi:hypothetical protein
MQLLLHHSKNVGRSLLGRRRAFARRASALDHAFKLQERVTEYTLSRLLSRADTVRNANTVVRVADEM